MPQETLQETIRQLAIKYNLTKAEVTAVIERLFARALCRWYGHDVVVILDEEGLSVNAYKRVNGIINQQPIEPLLLRRFLAGKAPRLLHRALEKYQTVKEAAAYKRHEHQFRWGEVIGYEPDGGLRVEVEVLPGEKIIAICPGNRLGVHERHLIKPGQRRAWHLRRVEPVLLHGTPRLKVTVDRVSKTLTAGLLREKAPGIEGVRCVKRYVGRKSFVEAPARLPKAAILAVKQELNEHIQVTITPSRPAHARGNV
ncbi:hypothetical protein ACHHRT_12750 [Desulfurivibrio sp. D14AmB]|uniref:hypothetical protein n=1 Tax=Desulfurivibrio sp. D14AmB TaxID=3374370 RepID=UPI00376F2F95